MKSRKNLCELGLGKEFLDMIPKARLIKENFNKPDFIKIRNLCSGKDTVKTAIKHTDWEKDIYKLHI